MEEQISKQTLQRNLLDACNSDNKIILIKYAREINPKLGLAEAKEVVEKHYPEKKGQALFDALRFEFAAFLPYTLSKEQFLKIIEAAIDSADTFYADPLDTVLFMLNNIKSKGGLQAVALQNEKFLNSL